MIDTPIYDMLQREYTWEADQLARGLCPWSGGPLEPREHEDGPRDPGGSVASCSLCDCFGYDRSDRRLGPLMPRPEVQVFFAPVDAFEDPSAPTLAELKAMTPVNATITWDPF